MKAKISGVRFSFPFFFFFLLFLFLALILLRICHCIRLKIRDSPLTVFTLSTISTLDIQTPQLLTILVLKFEQVNLLPVVSKNSWMSGKQCKHESGKYGIQTAYLLVFVSKIWLVEWQTVKILIRCCILHLILVYPVCSGLSI